MLVMNYTEVYQSQCVLWEDLVSALLFFPVKRISVTFHFINTQVNKWKIGFTVILLPHLFPKEIIHWGKF